MIVMETVANTNHRKVLQGRRVIGFVNYFPAIASIGRKEGWTFLPNKNDIDARYPTPSPVFDDPKAVLRHVRDVLAHLD